MSTRKGVHQFDLGTYPDEALRCCALLPGGARCPNHTDYYLGGKAWDDYTYVCRGHLTGTMRDNDTVIPTGGGK